MALSDEAMKDVVFKWTDIVIDQTNNLWTISLGFFVAAILVLAHAHSRPAPAAGQVAPPQPGRMLFLLLYLSTASTALSLFLAYKVKGSLITALAGIAASGTWSIPGKTEFNSLLQFLFFLTGIALFVIAFAIYRRTLAGALIGALKG